MSFLEGLKKITDSDIKQLLSARKSYGESWVKRGGTSAFMNLDRKWARIEQACSEFGWNIFDALLNDDRAEGVIDDLRDLRHYCLLIEEYLTYKFPEIIPDQHNKENDALSPNEREILKNFVARTEARDHSETRDDDPVHPDEIEGVTGKFVNDVYQIIIPLSVVPDIFGRKICMVKFVDDNWSTSTPNAQVGVESSAFNMEEKISKEKIFDYWCSMFHLSKEQASELYQKYGPNANIGQIIEIRDEFTYEERTHACGDPDCCK